MSDGELLCNYKKCRKVLTGIAYITRCSHAFCEEDGVLQIENQNFEKKCPACQSPLVKNYDLVKVTLNPAEQFKSMVLAGLRPEVVMDVATRAISFWSYQQHQEQIHQSVVIKSLKDFVRQLKSEAEVETGFLKSEIQILKTKQEDLERELEKQSFKCNELSEKLIQKTRETQKWQLMYEFLKRKQLGSTVTQCETTVALQGNPLAIKVGPQTMENLLTNQATNQDYSRPAKGVLPRMVKSPVRHSEHHSDDDFVFQPRATKTCESPKIFFENPKNFRPEAPRKY